MRDKKALILMAALWFALFGAVIPERAPAAESPNWMWTVFVVPPQGGWETETGRSILTVLAWHEANIADSGKGIGGHDVHFVPVAEAGEASEVRLPLDEHTAAVMSFAVPEVDRGLIQRLEGQKVPLLLAGGEELLIDKDGRPLPNVFALDMFRDYRCAAFANFAVQTLHRKAHVALAASRFTVDQEREAKITYSLLDLAGFMPMPFWMDASVSDSFSMVAQEIRSVSDGVLIAFIGGMGAREMWRGFMRVGTPWQLWNCAAPEPLYLSCKGMLFADQNLFLSERGGFSTLKRQLWDTRAMQLQDLVPAGRANALAEWLTRGIGALPQPVDRLDRDALLAALSRVRGIPFGAQTLDVTPSLHRPASRQVYIVEVRDHRFVLKDTLMTDALPYAPSY